MECSLSDFDAGGTDCTNRCRTTMFGTRFCTCTTTGTCGTGGTGCGGPCPMGTDDPAEEQTAEDAAARLAWERRAERRIFGPAAAGFRVAEATMARLERADPLVASVLQGVTGEDGQVRSGSFAGGVSIGTQKGGYPVIRFTAQVESSVAGAHLRVELRGHAEISAFEVDLGSAAGSNRLQLEDPSGFPSVARW
jgi:hypothetical protein